MSLTDAVSALHLTIYAELPLLLFLGIFCGVCLHMLRSGSKLDQVALLPLHDERKPQGSKEP